MTTLDSASKTLPRNSSSFFVLLILVALITGCNPDAGGEYYTIQGFAQGTTYRITYQHPTENEIQGRIDSLLNAYNMSLSTYEPESVISKINRNESMKTDSLFRSLFREAQRVYEISGGAFDITVGPLIDAWGFGPGEKLEVDSGLVDSLLQYVGMEKVKLAGDMVHKSLPGIRLDVNAIAQGHAVDIAAGYMEGLGCRNYMVEIGGEIRTKGKNPRGTFWRIGVDRPEYGSMIPGQQLQAIIILRDRSLATSGNYRRFYEGEDGIRITHSIDPATGYPRESRLLSATILTEDCITADAYATACMVMGLEKAKRFVESLEDTDAYFVYGDEDGVYGVWYTPALRKYIEAP